MGHTQFPRHKCLRGIPDDLIAFHLSNLLIVEPAPYVADYEPWLYTILKRTTRARLNIGWGVWAKHELLSIYFCKFASLPYCLIIFAIFFETAPPTEIPPFAFDVSGLIEIPLPNISPTNPSFERTNG